ncbi:MAG: hypothetical protein SOT55_02235 [Candidatus Cryptobacteroides sp.]|nr:hypothetical protein [Candidatus Cryptobacteroides sp.]
MKTIYRLFAAFSALSLFAAACTPVEEYKPGVEDNTDCYGVYFPAQETEFVRSPEEATVITFTVAREKTDGDLIVPINVKDTSSIFNIKPVNAVFEDGQSETTISFDYARIAVGQEYLVSLSIEGDEFVSKYSTLPSNLDFTVLVEKWNDLGVGTFTMNVDLWDPFTCAVRFFQSDLNPAIYRIKMHEVLEDGTTDLIFSEEQNTYLYLKVLKKGDKVFDNVADKDDLVFFDVFHTGIINSTYNAELLFVHPGSFSNFTVSDWYYNKVIQVKEDGSPAVIQLAPYIYMNGIGGWSFIDQDEAIILVLPGCELVNYSMEIEAGYSENGVLPVKFELGADVAKVKYAIYPGTLNSAQVTRYAGQIADGSAEGIATLPADGIAKLTLPETGVYTVVAVSFDATGEAQETATATINYVAEGDNKDVELYSGLVATGKYGKEYTSDNTLEYYIFGQDLVDIKIGLFEKGVLENNYEACVEEVLASESLSEEDIEAANTSSYVAVFKDCVPGTEYSVLAWASNGYAYAFDVASAKTTGKLVVSLEDMIGVYSTSITSYYNGPLKPLQMVIEPSDDEWYNLMVTTFYGIELDAPIYIDFDQDTNRMLFYDWQPILADEENDQAILFASASDDGNPIMFTITGKGKFSQPSGMFGLYVTDYNGTKGLGWADLFTSFSATKVGDLTSGASAAAPASIASIEVKESAKERFFPAKPSFRCNYVTMDVVKNEAASKTSRKVEFTPSDLIVK